LGSRKEDFRDFTFRYSGFQLDEVHRQRSYFVIHAPRQTGKTTAMLALAKELTDSGQYCLA